MIPSVPSVLYGKETTCFSFGLVVRRSSRVAHLTGGVIKEI